MLFNKPPGTPASPFGQQPPGYASGINNRQGIAALGGPLSGAAPLSNPLNSQPGYNSSIQSVQPSNIPQPNPAQPNPMQGGAPPSMNAYGKSGNGNMSTLLRVLMGNQKKA